MASVIGVMELARDDGLETEQFGSDDMVVCYTSLFPPDNRSCRSPAFCAFHFGQPVFFTNILGLIMHRHSYVVSCNF